MCVNYRRYGDNSINQKLLQLVTAQKVKLSVKGFFSKCDQIHSFLPAGIFLFKANTRNIRTMCEICSKLTVKMFVVLYLDAWCMAIHSTSL